MDNNKQEQRTLIFLNDYPTELDKLKVDLDNFVSRVSDITKDVLDKMERVEHHLNVLSDRMLLLESKLDKIMQSNKSLIKYFNEIHALDARELNYNIRSFYTRGNVPVGFVAEKSKLN